MRDRERNPYLPVRTGVGLLVLLLAACTPRPAPAPVPPAATEPAAATASATRAIHLPRVTILAINDVYRIAGVDGATVGGLARVRSLRARLEREHPELLVLHAGDLLFPSLASRQFRGEQMIDVLNLLDGDPDGFDPRMFVVFGNHEFDKTKLRDAAMLQDRIDESQFTWLGSNVEWQRGENGEPMIAADHLVRSALVESGGITVGIFGLTIDSKHPAYVESFGDVMRVARETTAELRRRGAELVVAVTHLEMSQDVALLERLGADGPDLVIGGHEHHRQAREAGGRQVIKADAEARTATVAHVLPRPGSPPAVTWRFHALDKTMPVDAEVDARVRDWLARVDQRFCAGYDPPEAPGCLDQTVGRTRVPLIGEELEIRGYETNLGNYIADVMLQTFAGEGADVAFINAGALRLNQDLPPGAITRWHIQEIFQYSDEVVLVRTTGRKLRQMVDRGVAGWTRSGRWLQVSGMAFRHHPDRDDAWDLTLLGPDGPRPIGPDDEILAVTVDHLAKGPVLDGEELIPYPGPPITLDELVSDALQAAGEEGIAPEVEGRICNVRDRPAPCLAVG